jgi:peptidoglycan/xylan/chitin deacetylase (PgdA/CDA1 family)/GT2 family glycosyltransferase
VTPELSVVIPTRRRPRLLRACLESLFVQTEPLDHFEVVVVLDGIDRETVEMLDRIQPPFELRVFMQEQAGASAARNHGAREARADRCLFLDDDVVADPQLIAEHLRMQRGPSVIAIGRIDKNLPSRAPRWARLRAVAWHGHFDRLAERTPTFNDCYGGNLCVPRDAFLAVGGFAVDIEVGHDVELAYRLEQEGLAIVYVPTAVVTEDDRETLRHFVADARRRGRANWQFYERHPELLPRLPLGGAHEMGWRWTALRRLLLASRMPPLLLAAVGRLMPRASRAARWYRFVYSYCHWRGIRDVVDAEMWQRLRRGTAILMYHAVAVAGERASRYAISERSFRRQMAWLRRRKYTVLSLDEFVRCHREYRFPPAKSVVITFDDGYADNCELALPVVERFGFPITIFLVSDSGGAAGWANAPELRDRPVMSRTEAKGLVGRVAFGSHTRTHPALPSLTRAQLEDEIGGSRRELEEALDVPVTIFAYPYGEMNAEVKDAVAQAGFVAACGIRPGRNRADTDRYALRRLEVRGPDSLLRFIATLWLGDTRSLLARRRSG